LVKEGNMNLRLIFVEDPKSGGFTVFFKQFPNIIAEGDTRKAAKRNLFNAIYDVYRDIITKL